MLNFRLDVYKYPEIVIWFLFHVSSESTIKALWIRMRKEEEPDVLENFEDFLSKVAKEIKRSQVDFKTLEAALKRLVCILNKLLCTQL